ncbi:hypothetical protein Hanom_Chr09g00838811 [Helianthus anomalus]
MSLQTPPGPTPCPVCTCRRFGSGELRVGRNRLKPGWVPGFRHMGWVVFVCGGGTFFCLGGLEVVGSVWIPVGRGGDRWCSCPWWWWWFSMVMCGCWEMELLMLLPENC